MNILQTLVRQGFLQKIPSAIKAPVKRILPLEHLYDTSLCKLGLDEIMPDDVFLCSYPKSGNTWLRFLIANLMHEDVEISIKNIETYSPEIESSSKRLNKLAKRPVMKTHCPFFARFPRFIYIYRDPRDVMISYYHYAVNNRFFRGDLPQFIRSATPAEHNGDWGAHIGGALAEHQKRGQDICLLRYEDMLEDPADGLNRIAGFLCLRKSQAQIHEAVEKSSFENLRKMELKQSPQYTLSSRDRAPGFFRVGKARQWEKALSKDDQKWVWTRFGEVMVKAGYPEH